MYELARRNVGHNAGLTELRRLEVAVLTPATARPRPEQKRNDAFPLWFRYFATCLDGLAGRSLDAVVIDARYCRDVQWVREAVLYVREHCGINQRVLTLVRDSDISVALQRLCAMNAIRLLNTAKVSTALYVIAYANGEAKVPFLVRTVEEIGVGLPQEIASVIAVLIAGRFRLSSVKLVARAFGCHPTTLQRRLRMRAGLEPANVIDQCKALATRILLSETNLSIRSIAGRMGFASSRSLNDLLVRSFGVGATAMRRGAQVTQLPLWHRTAAKQVGDSSDRCIDLRGERVTGRAPARDVDLSRLTQSG